MKETRKIDGEKVWTYPGYVPKKKKKVASNMRKEKGVHSPVSKRGGKNSDIQRAPEYPFRGEVGSSGLGQLRGGIKNRQEELIFIREKKID